MKLPLKIEDIEKARRLAGIFDNEYESGSLTDLCFDQAKLAIDLAERLEAADDLIEEYDRLFGDAYKYGRIKTLTQMYDSLTQEGKWKESQK